MRTITKAEDDFERRWRIFGGTWTVVTSDGRVIRGRKEPERPKLRIVTESD